MLKKKKNPFAQAASKIHEKSDPLEWYLPGKAPHTIPMYSPSWEPWGQMISKAPQAIKIYDLSKLCGTILAYLHAIKNFPWV